MLNLEAHNGRDLQNFATFLNQCEAAGVTDIRFVRQKLAEYINSGNIKARSTAKNLTVGAGVVCPECGRVMRKAGNDEGLNILGCVHCRYSEVR